MVAFVTVQGLITEEHDIFRTILGHLPGIEPLNVGHQLGPVAGPGGARTVDATFDQVTDPDIVIVPGALGTRQLVGDKVLCSWLHDVAPRCRWIAASSTGSVVLAAAGLLNGHPAATHWLAGDLLAEFGSDIADQRLNVDAERVITATGSMTAFEAAYLVIQRELGDRRGEPGARAGRIAEREGSGGPVTRTPDPAPQHRVVVDPRGRLGRKPRDLLAELLRTGDISSPPEEST